jgi:hypothetical protein
MKIIQIVVLMFVLLFLLGCGGPGEGQATYNYKQGFGSLEINFLDSAPPKKIYPESKFKMIVELNNQAAYDIKNGKVKLVGVDGKIFEIQPLQEQFNQLLGKSLTSPDGERIFKEFDGKAKELFQNAEKYQNPFFLKVSFDSVFEFVDTLCINPNLYGVFDSGCKVEERKTYSGQGAPVAVTEVESIIYPSSGGAEVEFRILVRNRGKGEANFIELEEAKLGSKELKDCRFQGSIEDPQARKVLFYKDKQEDTLICKLFLHDQKSYMTTLSLDFNYDYEITQQHKLNIIK